MHRVITMGQLFRHSSRIHMFPTCLYFSLSKGHFLRSQRNSADYISSIAAFQGVGGSHTWAERRGPEHWALQSDLRCLSSPDSTEAQGLLPTARWRFHEPATSAWPSPEMAWRPKQASSPAPTPSPQSSAIHLLTIPPYFWNYLISMGCASQIALCICTKQVIYSR